MKIKQRSDEEWIAYALRYLAEDIDEHRPKSAKRLREIAERIERDKQ